MYKPVILVILDGWGIGEAEKGNAVLEANTPTADKLNSFYPHIAIQASGISVGLPWGEPGNSEVGHISLGTGQVIYQNMPRITLDIQSGNFFKNKSFLEAIEHTKKNSSNLHIMGLLGKGGVHSTTDHLYAILELMRDQKAENVFLHIFTDGRDSSPTADVECIRELEERLKTYGIGKIATLGGRYFGMDRNNNWDRIEKAYKSMVSGEGEQIEDPIKYLEESYKREVFDEYIEPAVIVKDGKPLTKISDNDAIIFFNFREDRARQITKAFVLPGFNKFERKEIENLLFVSMVEYEADLPTEVAYPPIEIKECLGDILSRHNKKQLRISETEKFAHVTYFFNGGKEEPFPGEDRVIVPSKNVATFVEAPEMSAFEITEKVINFVKENKYDFILINYANADIVGHTGNLKAGIKAVETVDECLGKLIQEVLLQKGCLLVTADHGNAEEMINRKTGEPDTEHSTNPVPLWLITGENHSETENPESPIRVEGILSDIAPTVLELMEIEKPKEMTGDSLIFTLQD